MTRSGLAVRWAVSRICLLLQQCWDRTGPGRPLLPAPTLRPPFQPRNLLSRFRRPHPPPPRRLRDPQCPSLGLPPSCSTTKRSQIRQNYSTQAETGQRQVTLYPRATRGGGSGGRGSLLPREAGGRPAALENTKPAPRECPFPGHAEAVPR